MKHYLIVKDNIVIDLFSTKLPAKEDWVEADFSGGIHLGSDVRAYDKDWKLRPMEELVEEGLAPFKVEGEDGIYKPGAVLEKFVDGEVVLITDYEHVKLGNRELDFWEYIDEDNKQILTTDDLEVLISAGKLTDEEFDEYIANDLRTDRDDRLSRLDTLVMNPLRWADFTEEEQTSLAEYRKLLLDVPQQKEFPGKVEWPEVPSFVIDLL